MRDVHSEPTVSAVMQAFGKGKSAEVVAHLIDGLRKAGLQAE